MSNRSMLDKIGEQVVKIGVKSAVVSELVFMDAYPDKGIELGIYTAMTYGALQAVKYAYRDGDDKE